MNMEGLGYMMCHYCKYYHLDWLFVVIKKEDHDPTTLGRLRETKIVYFCTHCQADMRKDTGKNMMYVLQDSLCKRCTGCKRLAQEKKTLS